MEVFTMYVMCYVHVIDTEAISFHIYAWEFSELEFPDSSFLHQHMALRF